MALLDDFGDLIEGGATWIEEELGGPLKALAENEWGVHLVRAVAGTFSAGLAPILGPQLASVAWALPGLLKGESFDKAWFDEFSYRVQGVAEWLGVTYGKQLINEFKGASDALMADAYQAFGNLPLDEAVRRLNVDVEAFAARLGIRDDVAARVIALATRTNPPSAERYDLYTGKRTRLVSLRQALDVAGRGPQVRAAMAGSHANGSVIRWMRGIP